MMTKDGGERMATADGAMLGTTSPQIFDPDYWAGQGALTPVAGGRGAAWFVGCPPEEWVLRHYRRGGFIARLSEDRYVWAGESRVRAFAEWRLLCVLYSRGLPVPEPIAARYRRHGLLYRCDLITRRLEGMRSLSAVLAAAPLSESEWRAVGAALNRLHAAGAYHADLNAHNILVNGLDVRIIDFDRGCLRAPGSWAAGNLHRLRRSLEKVTRPLAPERFRAADWDLLLSGYHA